MNTTYSTLTTAHGPGPPPLWGPAGQIACYSALALTHAAPELSTVLPIQLSSPARMIEMYDTYKGKKFKTWLYAQSI